MLFSGEGGDISAGLQNIQTEEGDEEVLLTGYVTRKRKRVMQQSLETQSLAYVNRELGSIRDSFDILDAYYQFFYASFVLHPLALNEDTIRYFLAGNLGDSDSTLSLSIAVAMAMGGRATCNEAFVSEYEHKIQQQYVYLKEHPSLFSDYASAQALCVLSSYMRCFKCDKKESLECLTGAIEICKKINATNTDCFRRCILALAAYGPVNEDSLQEIHSLVHLSEKSPVYTLPAPLSSQKASIFGHADLLLACLLIGLRWSAKKIRQQNQNMDMFIEGLLQALESFDAEIRQKSELYRSSYKEPVPKRTSFMLSLYSPILQMRCNLLKSVLKERALPYAQAISAKIKDTSFEYQYIPSDSMLLCIRYVLCTFFQLRAFPELKDLLGVLMKWEVTCPLLLNIKNKFERKMSKAETRPQPKEKAPSIIIEWHQEDATTTKRKSKNTRKRTTKAKKPKKQDEKTETTDTTTITEREEEVKVTQEASPEVIVFTDGAANTNYNNNNKKKQSTHTELAKRFRKNKVWNVGGLTTNLSEILKFQSYYRKYLWHFFPLHPAVLETPNASYFLRVEENNVELSTLNFSFNLCIALGAMIAGKKELSTAFFNRADEQLAALQKNQPDYSKDYSMALGLVVMAAQAINLNLNMEKVESYLDTMTKICNDHNRCNSDAFVRLLLLLAFHSMPYKEKVSLEELILKQTVQENFPLPSIPLDSISLIALDPQATEKRAFSRTFQISMPVSLGSMRDISTVLGLEARVMFAMEAGKGDPKKRGFKDALELLKHMSSTVRKFQTEQESFNDPWPASFTYHTRLFILSCYTRCFFELGDYEQASDCAHGFYNETENADVGFVYVGIEQCVGQVLDVLMEMKDIAGVVQQLSMLDKWLKTVPAVARLVDSYQEKVAEKLNAIIEEPLYEGETPLEVF